MIFRTFVIILALPIVLMIALAVICEIYDRLYPEQENDWEL